MTATIETGQDKYIVDNATLREFIGAVQRIQQENDNPREVIAGIRPHFEGLLADKSWLPRSIRNRRGGGMARHGPWLLFRRAMAAWPFRRWWCAGAQTPVHDHLAWGLVGLYRGTQDEDVFTRR